MKNLLAAIKGKYFATFDWRLSSGGLDKIDTPHSPLEGLSWSGTDVTIDSPHTLLPTHLTWTLSLVLLKLLCISNKGVASEDKDRRHFSLTIAFPS